MRNNQKKQFAVFSVFNNGSETFINPVDEIKPASSFKKAEKRLLSILQKPVSDKHPVGYSRSTLTILPIYRLKGVKQYEG